MSSLRELIEDTKRWYTNKYGKLDWQYYDEGLPWTIQEYHSHMGSLEDFTTEDWTACADEGWNRADVELLCEVE